ncbi:MAG TPA: hypothetical protein VKI19_09215 [Acidimicrobiales bacterium]|nr:hypothetical protein [Acidimicrobiales bacterium]
MTSSTRAALRWAVLGPAVLASASVLAGCNGTHRVSAVGSPAAQVQQPNGSTPIVFLRALGGHQQALANQAGDALYTYSADQPGHPACTGSCLTNWRPLLLPAGTTTAKGGPGVTGLGTMDRAEGVQVTLGGHPLYTFARDTRPGEVNGQGVVLGPGRWALAVEAPAPAPTTSAAPSTSTITAAPATVAPATVAPSTAPPTTRAPATTAPPTTRAPATTAPPTTQPPPTSTTTPIGPPIY